MTNWTFTHLNVHSEYSINNSLIKIKQLVDECIKLRMPAVALTDHNNLCGVIKFYTYARQKGIKPIVGCQFNLRTHVNETTYPLTLLATNLTGYFNLIAFSTKVHLDAAVCGEPILEDNWLTPESCAGLIAISGGRGSDILSSVLKNDLEPAINRLNWWQNIFPQRFYLAVQQIDKKEEDIYLAAIISFACLHNCPVVATNDVYFITAEDFDAHEVRTCITDGVMINDKNRPRRYTSAQYLRGMEEMQDLFSAMPAVLINSVEITKRCNLQLDLTQSFLPNYTPPSGLDVNAYLKQKAQAALDKHLIPLAAEQQQIYQARLEYEIDVIVQMGFSGYFLIVMDFIRYAKAENIPVGPGRGSGAGSLVAYCLGITAIDPIKYDLLFERFLNPERISMPDFDIDFCIHGREKVIQYVREVYGSDSVAQIITFNTMSAKAVVRDVARVQGKNYAFADQLARLIPHDIGITLTKAMADDPALASFVKKNSDANEIMTTSYQLEGLIKNVGTHAGGVIIAPDKLTKFAPLYVDYNLENIVCQYDKKTLEHVGLVKFDFLGLRTLTVIDRAWKKIYQLSPTKRLPCVKSADIPLDDKKTFELIQTGFTTGIFQLESQGIQNLIRRLKPDCFDDITALVALFRPGPLRSGMVDDFIARKHKLAPVTYFHPALEVVLKNTYGIILYQEQVMKIAEILGGYSLGQADVLRRAMGYKDIAIMEQQREKFCQGAQKNNINIGTAEHIFDLIEKFAGYGFNKSHSVAYAKIAYETAWLKTHYPAIFMAAVLNQDINNTDKLAIIIHECKRKGMTIVPPSVDLSLREFIEQDSNTIIYGLGAIKGLSSQDIDLIVAERANKKYFSLIDFCHRVGIKCKKNTLKPLIYSGALDMLAANRASVAANIEHCLQIAQQSEDTHQLGVQDMFSNLIEEQKNDLFVEVPWTIKKKLMVEHASLGFYLTGHPVGIYADEFKQIGVVSIKHINISTRALAGIVVVHRIIKKNNKESMMFILDDGTDKMRLSLTGDTLQAYKDIIEKDQMLIIKGQMREDKFAHRLVFKINIVLTLEDARCKYATALRLTIVKTSLDTSFINKIAEILGAHQQDKGCPIQISYSNESIKSLLLLSAQWKVLPSDELLDQLEKHIGADKVRLIYQ